MLRSLSIRDFVIVDTLDIDLESGFTALTGETGAGKSILLDALSLVLGERADAGQIREGKSKAQISALFSVKSELIPTINTWLEAQGFDAEDEGQTLILKRIIEANGKSKAYINGGIAALNQMRELADKLVDIHGQHAHQLLLRSGAQKDLLDRHANLQELVLEVKQLFANWQQAKRALMLAQEAGANYAKEKERLAWQLDELQTLNPKPGEWEEVDLEYSRLANASRLIEGSQTALKLIEEDDGNALSLIGKALSEIEDLAKVDANLEDARIALDAAQIQIAEASHSLNRYLQKIDVDPERLAEVEERMKSLMAAAKKFKVTPSELPGIKQHLEEQLQAVEDAQDIAKLEKTVASSEKEFLTRAQVLSKSRHKAAHQLQDQVTAAMQELSMAGGKFTIELVPLIEGASHGLENIEFHVAAHPGVSPKPLSKVASGGELARISLAISVITSKANATPTLIFDEVDSGIGGAVADTVGKRLKELGLTNQVLCVTHLPQVASQANHHWKVSKSSSASQTLSTIQALNRNERVEEVARMLGGSEITDITRRHARELLGA